MKKIILIICIFLAFTGCQDKQIVNNTNADKVVVSLPSNNEDASGNDNVTEETSTVEDNDSEGIDSDETDSDSSQEESQTDTSNDTSDDSSDTNEDDEIEESADNEISVHNYSQDEVLWLQESLKIAGYYTARDGSFGNMTLQVLIQYQTDVGITSGLFDLETRESLEAIRQDRLAPGYQTDKILLNKNYYLPSEFVPVDLREVLVNKNKHIELPAHVADQVEQLIAAATEDGVDIWLASGYRSYDYQEGIFSRRVARNGFEEAQTVVAIPGESEHQTGLAIDITSPAMGYGLDQTFDQQPEFIWMMENCYKYGFILRYPKDRTDITQYVYEPWHYRYIGDVEMAKEIMDNGITLEEYFE